MALEAYINGKSSEDLVKESLRAIGCYVDERERYNTDWAKIRQSGRSDLSELFFRFPFQFESQKGIKKDRMQFGVDKIPDFKSMSYFIEVKSISETTKNKKKSNEDLVGKILVEYKKYVDYFEYRSYRRDKEMLYYVLIGPCDKELILSYLQDYSSWYWMKDRLQIVFLDELVEIFSEKIKEYNEKLVA